MGNSQIDSYYLHQYRNSEQHETDTEICKKWPALKANYAQDSNFDISAFQKEQEEYLAAKERIDNLDMVLERTGGYKNIYVLNPDNERVNNNVSSLEPGSEGTSNENNRESSSEEVYLKAYRDSVRIINNKQYTDLYNVFIKEMDDQASKYFLEKEYVMENDYYGWYVNYGYLQKDLDLAGTGDEQARRRVQNFYGYMAQLEDKRIPDSTWDMVKKAVSQGVEQVQQKGVVETVKQGVADSLNGIQDSTKENIKSKERLWENIQNVKDPEKREMLKGLFFSGSLTQNDVQAILFGIDTVKERPMGGLRVIASKPTPDHPNTSLYQAFENAYNAERDFLENGFFPAMNFLQLGKFAFSAAKNVSNLKVFMGSRELQGEIVSVAPKKPFVQSEGFGKPVENPFPVNGSRVRNPLKEVDTNLAGRVESDAVTKGLESEARLLTKGTSEAGISIGGFTAQETSKLVATNAERAAAQEAALAAKNTGWIDSAGNINWPKNDGFVGPPKNVTLQPGAKIDRYGYESGSYVSPQGTSYEMRALVPGTEAKPYNVYEVVKPIDALGGEIAPWFNQPGGGIQLKLGKTIQELLDEGYIRKVEL